MRVAPIQKKRLPCCEMSKAVHLPWEPAAVAVRSDDAKRRSPGKVA